MISRALAFLKSLWDGWDRFFFAPVGDLQAGVFRFLFAFNALLMYSVRFKNWHFYYTEEGFMPLSDVYNFLPDYLRPVFSFYPTTPALSLACNVGLLVALVFLLVGFGSRLAALIGFVLHVALIQRDYAIAYGADFITTFMFFSLIFMKSDRRFSLAAWLRARRGIALRDDRRTIGQYLSSAGYRVMQIQLCLIYAYTGLEKMKGQPWWDGSAIWGVIGNQQIMFFDFSIVAKVPLLLAVMTFTTLLFEIYFAAVVWTPLKKYVLILGVMMHVGIAFSIGLFYFSFGMMCVYVLWLNSEALESFLLRTMKLSPAWVGRSSRSNG